ncbi:MAG: exodeoxyribonuclease III [Candidatus Ryanbacteria bacterium RIFCSPLOWO2_12_FULL_47_9c]|uniref:Exodeoxyribonuclease III n=2 Tax=Parcubacteria group TaxID=1794811 RepID=A0A1G2H582_9BACT|nr:MAG: Exodeoxyribonuclease III [Candidatus Giovannonibacteria bacterium GW2011_GWB1_47_6b]OGZ57623.1 MAG: exodeoxyribonuclease III [Candidatus Ryanbacteria bacterium RIFCSPLOWO2_12_FULL_47_9c]
MKIISWNINGLRAVHAKGLFLPFVKKEKPDILCIQETKSDEEQLPEELRDPDGYVSFFSSSRARKGYSGVAIYSRPEPENIEYGMGIKKFDDEGRIVQADYGDFVLLNVYFPNGGSGPERLKYKLEFYDAFLNYIQKLRAQKRHVIFCGDVNTAHHDIDLARPKENEHNSGFLPEERAWLDTVAERGYVDVFRHFYPKKRDVYTYWDLKTRARDRNVGWRIDYFFVSPDIIKNVKGVKILSDVFGSDHCPVAMELA